MSVCSTTPPPPALPRSLVSTPEGRQLGYLQDFRTRLGDLVLRLLLGPDLCPPGSLCRRDLLACGTAHPPRWLRGLGSLHLALSPPLLEQPRQLLPGSGAHAATPAWDSRRFRQTTCSPASGRTDGFECCDRTVDAVALRPKFRQNAVNLHRVAPPAANTSSIQISSTTTATSNFE